MGACVFDDLERDCHHHKGNFTGAWACPDSFFRGHGRIDAAWLSVDIGRAMPLRSSALDRKRIHICAAYFAEIFRGGLLAIDRGQYEACQVLGLSRVQTTVRVILPQMIRVALPSITNESITLIKDTALVFSIAVLEILYYAKAAVTRTGNVFPYVIAFVIYLLLNTVLQMFFKWLEKKTAY